jgi:hypothetical protein
MLRRFGILVGIALLGSGLVAPAAAATSSGIVAAPSAGLRDAQSITVVGSGFERSVSDVDQQPAPGRVTVSVCSSSVVQNPLDGYSLCRNEYSTVPVDASGRFTTPLAVRRVGPTVSGQTVDCTTGPNACVVMALEYVSWSSGPGVPRPDRFLSASAPISFRAENFADCAASTWRSFTDARGHVFRNRVGCYVSVLLLKLLGR